MAAGRLVFVGISPPPVHDPYATPFVDTLDGYRLGELLDIDQRQLGDDHDLEHLFPGHPGHAQFAARLWMLAASALLTRYPRRVIIGCGARVSVALGGHDQPGSVALSRDGGAVASLPHPSPHSPVWNDPKMVDKATHLLAGCVELAARPAPYTETDIADLAELWS